MGGLDMPHQADSRRHRDVEAEQHGYMAAVVVAGVLLNRNVRVWWIECAASVVLLVWIGHEAKEAFEAAHGECDEHCEGQT